MAKDPVEPIHQQLYFTGAVSQVKIPILMGTIEIVRQKQLEVAVERIIRENVAFNVKPPSHQAYYYWQRNGKIPKPSIPLGGRVFGYSYSAAIGVIQHALKSKNVPIPNQARIQQLLFPSEMQLELFIGGSRKLPITEFLGNAKTNLNQLATTGGVLVLTDATGRPTFRISRIRRTGKKPDGERSSR